MQHSIQHASSAYVAVRTNLQTKFNVLLDITDFVVSLDMQEYVQMTIRVRPIQPIVLVAQEIEWFLYNET
jgi:hypothetical protein